MGESENGGEGDTLIQVHQFNTLANQSKDWGAKLPAWPEADKGKPTERWGRKVGVWFKVQHDLEL